MKLKRVEPKQKETIEMKSLIEDLMENGTNGDSTKWKRAFRFLSRNKELMKKVLEVDSTRAFEQYYSLGEKRTLTLLSATSGHEVNKLGRWRKKYKWEKQIAERDNLLYDALKAKAVLSAAMVKIEYSGFINKAIRDMINNLDEYNQRIAEHNRTAKTAKEMMKYQTLIYNADDLEKLVKLDLLLRGEATDRKEINISEKQGQIESAIKNDESTKELLRQLWYRTRSYNSENTKELANPEDTKIIDVN